MHFGRRLWRPLLITCGALATFATSSPGAAPRAGARVRERVVADSLLLARAMRGQRLDSLMAILDRDVAAARRHGDPGILARLLRLRGVAHAVASRTVAIPDLDEALRLAESVRDTTLMMVSLRWRAYVAGVQRRFDDQDRLAGRLLELAGIVGDGRMQAVAHNFMGWIASQRGDQRAALSHLEAAALHHRRSADETEEGVVLTALGSVQSRLGDYDGARESYRRQLDIARRLGNRWLEAQAQTGLGTIESLVGDPIAALDYHRSAWEIQRSFGETVDAAAALLALVHAHRQAGHPEEALALGRDGVAMCARRGFHATRSAFLAELGWTETELSRPGAADDSWRRVLAMGDSADVDSRVSAVQGIARALGYAGRAQDMRELLESRSPGLVSRCSARGRLELQAALLHAFVLGRDWTRVTSLAEALGAEAESLEASGIAIWIWRNAGASFAALGRPDRAGAAYERGIRNWETWRRDASRAEWQERRTRQVVPLAEGYANFLADRPGMPESTRVAAAFDLLQRIKSRTLRERLSRSDAPGRAAPNDPPVTSRRLRAGVLRPGELLLEWFSGENTLFLFALSRGEQRLLRFRDGALRERLGVARGLHDRRPRSDAELRAATSAARELGRDLLAGVADMVAAAGTVIVAPDDFLHEVSFATLEIPGSRIRGPLGAGRSLVLVPSAAVLAGVRAGGPQGRGRGLLAIVPDAPAGGRGMDAASEVAWLADEFRQVTVFAPSPGRPPTPADLAGYGALHFAGHATADRRFPWRSAIALSTAAEAARDSGGARETALRADAIAASQLDARLAVLASCQTVGAGSVRGEGVAGLASAFLIAGVPTVIATLWPVDDTATERLMREFYTRLSRGLAAGRALREAQDRIRNDHRTRHPWYWAGFVLIGESETRLPLEPKPLSPERILRSVVPRSR